MNSEAAQQMLEIAQQHNSPVGFYLYTVDPVLNKIILITSAFGIAWYTLKAPLAKAAVNCIGYLIVLSLCTYIAFDLWNYFITGVPVLWIEALTVLLGKWGYTLYTRKTDKSC